MKSMRRNSLACILALASGFWISTDVSAQNALAIKTPEQKQSYAVGADLARNLKRQAVPLDNEALIQGMRDALAGSKMQMSEDDLRDTLRALQLEQRRRAVSLRQVKVQDDNAEKGAAFLEQNRTNQGVVCLPSGLQYKILKSGGGPKPTATDTVECHFRGTLIDGQEFAESDPNKPATLKMSDVIPGWKEALHLMPAGSKWRLFIPPQLAYGTQGVGRARLGPKIGPNTTLIYDLELLSVKKTN